MIRLIGALDDVVLYTGDARVSKSTLEGLFQAPVREESYFYKLRPGVDSYWLRLNGRVSVIPSMR